MAKFRIVKTEFKDGDIRFHVQQKEGFFIFCTWENKKPHHMNDGNLFFEKIEDATRYMEVLKDREIIKQTIIKPTSLTLSHK